MARILVIDDDQAVRLTMEVILEQEGYDLVFANDGEQGIRQFERAAPDLVISDIIMPNKEGIETITAIRLRNPLTPIIAISGGGRIGNTDFLTMALQVGANEVLAKPFEHEELTGAVRRLIAQAARQP